MSRLVLILECVAYAQRRALPHILDAYVQVLFHNNHPPHQYPGLPRGVDEILRVVLG